MSERQATATRLLARGSDRLSNGDLFLFCLALTVVLAERSFRFFESPFLRLENRWGRSASLQQTPGPSLS